MAASAVAPLRRSARNVKKEAAVETKIHSGDKQAASHAIKRSASPNLPKRPNAKKVKAEPVSPSAKHISTISARDFSIKTETTKADILKERKLKSFSAFSKKSPYPDFARPTAEECRAAHKILAKRHGERLRPEEVVAPTNAAGCGDSPSVLDALVRTILSQNTSNKNSTRAKLSMDEEYGGSDKWEEIANGGQARLEKSIQTGGLAATKSKVIIGILQQTKAKYGLYSLDHLFEASDEDAMKEMISFQGVGPKTASCVLLFCLQRPSFAVDTHVHRITGLLGWRPAAAGREETQAHLDAVVPDEEKYPLHVLFVTHGRQCEECKAGGSNAKTCELRRVFKNGRFTPPRKTIKDEDNGDIKKEED
ncbi:HhH-GPD superfamily base excision DNA repair protein [Metarhizium robertsii]|uniref:Endonuclease III n=2 Tax=Metarhizium robertsii TaxID=568076 RepID=E9EXL0_METRA|nr:endonuclease III [Metarhizium robertsii ARSEF 23]EFY99830.1 endonuclease III [Metarhizium robertsii ARSEF 23]EXV06521.1 HhH-GPD superfamily base excision DNA repair protein [Metarhizium robertsii]